MSVSADPRPSHNLPAVLPFWVSLLLIPIAWLAAIYGSWFLLLMPAVTWQLFSLLDLAMGLNKKNADPQTPDEALTWYNLVTLIWVPLQIVTLFGVLAYVSWTDHLNWAEQWALFVGIGIMTGGIGINYSHELMHQKSRLERWMADILLASVLYSHFRSEHLLVHHRYVGTARDAVTARYNENFWRFFRRVLVQCWHSAFEAEKAQLARRSLHWTDRRNPFWRYLALQALFIGLAFWIGGLAGILLFTVQAFTAVLHLELVNYVEHYGLTRKHLGDGKYEHTQPRHSWNSAHWASNWLLINLQRHSDHHFKPDRRFPLLQNYDDSEVPQLPYGYPIMILVAAFPRLWRRVMNPRVLHWRAQFYPEITDWTPYNKGTNPLPR